MLKENYSLELVMSGRLKNADEASKMAKEKNREVWTNLLVDNPDIRKKVTRVVATEETFNDPKFQFAILAKRNGGFVTVQKGKYSALV